MLADEELIEAQLLHQQCFFGVLGQIGMQWAARRMQRHHELTKTQNILPISERMRGNTMEDFRNPR
jgi:hypothetical protein